MIHHKITNIHNADRESRSMPESTYYGFAIGADAHHHEMLVIVQDEEYFVSIGSPVVLPVPVKNVRPVVMPLHLVTHFCDADSEALGTDGKASGLSVMQSKVHVIGMTCCDDLHVPVPSALRMISEEVSFSDGGETVASYVAYAVPFIGRKEAVFSITGDAGNVEIKGSTNQPDDADIQITQINFDEEDGFSPLTETYTIVAATAHASGTVDYMIQDVNHDNLVLKIGDGSFGPDVVVRVRVR